MSLIEGLRVAMLGTTDGDFIDPNSDIPAGEMFRLAAEYVEAALPSRIEAVARTLFVEDVPGIFEAADWDTLSEAGREDFRRVARAAIRALSDDAAPGGDS